MGTRSAVWMDILIHNEAAHRARGSRLDRGERPGGTGGCGARDLGVKGSAKGRRGNTSKDGRDQMHFFPPFSVCWESTMQPLAAVRMASLSEETPTIEPVATRPVRRVFDPPLAGQPLRAPPLKRKRRGACATS